MKKSLDFTPIGAILLWIATLSGTLTAQTSLQNYQQAYQVLMDCAQAMGGMRAFQQIEDVRMTLKGTAYDEGQSQNPYADWFERAMNGEIIFQPRAGLSYEKIHTLTIGGLLYDPIFILKNDGTGMMHQPSSDEWFELKGLDISILKGIPQLYPPRMFPFEVIRQAMRNAGGLRYIQRIEDEHFISVPEADGTQLTLVFSDKSKLLQRIELLSDHLVFGDLTMKICYDDYRVVNSLQMPHHLVFKYGEQPFMDLKTTHFQVNTSPDPSLFEMPADKQWTKLPQPFVPKKLGEGLWFLPVYAGLGTTYNVMLVEFDQYFLVVDAPLFDGYSRAIGRVANSLSVGKPIKYVVTTHYHTDHIGGIGHFIASGSTIICNQKNQAFIKDLAKVKHTIYPNALTFNPKEAVIESYTQQKTISDGQQKVVLYEINNSPHVEEMTLVYVPAEKLLFVADLLMVPHNGTLPPDNESLQFLKDFIQKHKLEVERFAPGHGVVIDKNTFYGKKASKGRATSLLDLEFLIGDWKFHPDDPYVKKFPDLKDRILYRYSWTNPDKKVMRWIEAFPVGQEDARGTEGTIIFNPTSGYPEMLAYEMREDFLFNGHIELKGQQQFVLHNQIYYGLDKDFALEDTQKDGIAVLKTSCKLEGHDSIKCKTEYKKDGQWKVWGPDEYWTMIRVTGK